MSEIRPFTVSFASRDIEQLQQRLAQSRLPEKETVDDWTQGVPLSYIGELVDYWQNSYDFNRLERQLNQFPHFITEIDSLDIHFIHVRSPEPQARPLIITHGWPGSVVEFLKVIGPLADPVAHGGDAADAFHVVCPSLPGYGFSAKPRQTGWGLQKIANAWGTLMARLGYDNYFAQGGDWGASVTTAIAKSDTEHCRGIHLNLVSAWPNEEQMKNLSEEDRKGLAKLKYYQDWDSGYAKEQSTRPQTVGYALADSPVGQLAWIVEKFYAWTDCHGHPENALSRDEMLDNVSLYWLTSTAASSARLYWESLTGIGGDRDISVPTGASLFPAEIFLPTRAWAENVFNNIVHWNRLDKGGHFAAFEQPELFVAELRAAFRLMDCPPAPN